MKVFKMSDCPEWWVGESKESVVNEFKTLVGEEDWKECEEDGYPEEVSEEGMDKLTCHDEEGNRHTFRQAVQIMIDEKCKFPAMLCSHDY